MALLRTIACPACGKTYLLGQRCPCGGRAPKVQRSSPPGAGAVRFVVVLVASIIVIAGVALAVGEAKGPGYGIGVAIVAWLLLHASRLAYDWEDGIDIRMLLLPGPLDWSTKLQSLVNLFTSPRSHFRAAYIGGFIAFVITSAVMVPRWISDGSGAKRVRAGVEQPAKPAAPERPVSVGPVGPVGSVGSVGR